MVLSVPTPQKALPGERYKAEKIMDTLELTRLFMDYAETKKHLEKLQAQIEAEVLTLEESQNIAGVKATYYKASQVVDYESACANVPAEIVEQYSTTKTTVKWAEVAKAAEVDFSEFITEKPARVVVK